MIYFFVPENAPKEGMLQKLNTLFKAGRWLILTGLIAFGVSKRAEATYYNITFSPDPDFKIEAGPHSFGDRAGTVTSTQADGLSLWSNNTYFGTPSLTSLISDSRVGQGTNSFTQGGVVVAYALPLNPIKFGKLDSNFCQVDPNYELGCKTPVSDVKEKGVVTAGHFLVIYSGNEVDKNKLISYPSRILYSVNDNGSGAYSTGTSNPGDFRPTPTQEKPSCAIDSGSTTGDVPLGEDITYTGTAGNKAISKLGEVDINAICTGDATVGSLIAPVGVRFTVADAAVGASRYTIKDHPALSIMGREASDTPSKENFCNDTDDSDVVKSGEWFWLGDTSPDLKGTQKLSRKFWWGVCENKTGEPGSGKFRVIVNYEVNTYG